MKGKQSDALESAAQNLSADSRGRMQQRFGKQADGHIVLIPQPSSDPHDPLTWPWQQRFTLLFTICFCAWAATLAPASGQLAYFPQTTLYHRSPTELSYSISAAVAGLLAGPLILVPFATVFGRTSVIFWCLIAIIICQIWAASMTRPGDYNTFIISRLMCGLFGGPPTILGSGFIMDIFFLHQRGRAFACYELSLLFGVICGPTIGGFVVQNNAWPVAFWWTLAPLGIAAVLLFFFGQETRFARVGSSKLYPLPPSPFFRNRIATLLPGTQVVPQYKVRELIDCYKAPLLICLSPVVMIAGLYMFVAFGFTLLLAILSAIYLQTPLEVGGYGFTPYQNAAFTFVSWITVIAAQAISLLMSDKLPLWVAKHKSGGIWHPEYRLWNMWFPFVVAPLGLALVAITLEYHLHYMVLALGTFLVNTAAQLSVPLLINYTIECFTMHAVEVSVAMNVYRLAFGLALGFFVEPWTEAVGRGWVFGMASLLVFSAGILIVLLAWKGENLRRKIVFKGLASSEEGQRISTKPE